MKYKKNIKMITALWFLQVVGIYTFKSLPFTAFSHLSLNWVVVNQAENLKMLFSNFLTEAG